MKKIINCSLNKVDNYQDTIYSMYDKGSYDQTTRGVNVSMTFVSICFLHFIFKFFIFFIGLSFSFARAWRVCRCRTGNVLLLRVLMGYVLSQDVF